MQFVPILFVLLDLDKACTIAKSRWRVEDEVVEAEVWQPCDYIAHHVLTVAFNEWSTDIGWHARSGADSVRIGNTEYREHDVRAEEEDSVESSALDIVFALIFSDKANSVSSAVVANNRDDEASE